MEKQTQFSEACLISPLHKSNKDRVHLLLWEPAELSKALWRAPLPWLGWCQSQRKGFKCSRLVGLQQPREDVPLPAVPIKARFTRREQPVPSCTRHQKRKGWNSVQVNCKCRGDPAEFVGSRDLVFILTLNFSPHPRTVCSHIMNKGHVRTLCVC